uniref:hypothetical protein n=1 Tax=Nocardia abscessus TaxID=120957 RepID=UPI002457D44A
GVKPLTHPTHRPGLPFPGGHPGLFLSDTAPPSAELCNYGSTDRARCDTDHSRGSFPVRPI